MNKTFKTKHVNGRTYSLLTLPGTNLFKFEIVNLFGSNIERAIAEQTGNNVYGISHFIEHLGFRAPKDYSTDQLLSLLKREGRSNASTDHDRINYWFKTTMNRADLAIRLVCNYALNDLKHISTTEFDTEKKVVYNEAKQYADDDQTMFYFNSTAALCGYHAEDNVIGIPETVDTFTIDDAIEVKQTFLQSGEQRYNITYDSTVMSEDEAIAKVERELERFNYPPVSATDDIYQALSVDEQYHSMIKAPVVGQHYIANESEQAMTLLNMNVIGNIVTARMANKYLATYSDTSLTDIIREKNGLTYHVSFYDESIGYNPYTVFACDVTRGTEERLMQLFVESINSSVDAFNEESYTQLIDAHQLQRTLTNVNQESYNSLFWTALWYPYIIGEYEEQFGVNIDDALTDMDATLATYDRIKSDLDDIRQAVNEQDYGIVTNVLPESK